MTAPEVAQPDAARAGTAPPLGAPQRGIAARPINAIARVAVLGARGYSGQEFVRLALSHPGLRLAALCSRERAGRTPAELLPGLDARAPGLPPIVEPGALPALFEDGAIDTLVTCLPHGAWKEFAAAHPALEAGLARIVDLSADHRADAASGAGSDAGSSAGSYVYGLPEAFRAALAGSTRVANPGCYPTAAALALLPAAELGLLGGPIMIGALSGVSGAGRAPQLRTSFVELDGGASLYKVGAVHAHVAEMERTLLAVAGTPHRVGFAPQLVPMSRGILLTANVALSRPVTPDEAHAIWSERYAREPFVRVLPAGEWPETRAVRNSNRCDIAVTTLHEGTTLLATAALDNLVKGAAGQAVQNLNLMLGWPEDCGLPVHGRPW